jgi:hypothetical protein
MKPHSFEEQTTAAFSSRQHTWTHPCECMNMPAFSHGNTSVNERISKGAHPRSSTCVKDRRYCQLYVRLPPAVSYDAEPFSTTDVEREVAVASKGGVTAIRAPATIAIGAGFWPTITGIDTGTSVLYTTSGDANATDRKPCPAARHGTDTHRHTHAQCTLTQGGFNYHVCKSDCTA